MVRVAIADEDVGAGRWGWCHGLLRSRSVRRRSISPTPLEQTEVLSRLQPEWRISGWSGQLQGKASARRVRRAEPRRWRERVPWAGCRSVAFAHPTPPIRIARRDSSYPSPATGADLSRSQFVSGEI